MVSAPARIRAVMGSSRDIGASAAQVWRPRPGQPLNSVTSGAGRAGRAITPYPQAAPLRQRQPSRGARRAIYRGTLQVVGALAVGGDIEPLALLFLCDPQSHQELHDAQRHVGHHGGPREHEANGLELNEELRADSRVADGARRPVDRARAAERRGVEDSGHERAEDAADRSEEHTSELQSLTNL